jgi:hypothetical protein
MRPLSFLSHKMLRKPARKRGFVEVSVLEKWPEIFPSYGAFMRPVALRKGTLKVATNSGSAANNLRMQGSYLIDRINQYFGYGAVKNIQFDIRHFTAEEKVRVEPLVASDKAVEYAHDICKDIKNDGLQASFENLAMMVYEEKQNKENDLK